MRRRRPPIFGLFLPIDDTLCFHCRYWCANNTHSWHFPLFPTILIALIARFNQEPANRKILLFIHDTLCSDSDYWWSDNRCPWRIALYLKYSLLWLHALSEQEQEQSSIAILLFIHNTLRSDSDYWWADKRCAWRIALYPKYSLLWLQGISATVSF